VARAHDHLTDYKRNLYLMKTRRPSRVSGALLELLRSREVNKVGGKKVFQDKGGDRRYLKKDQTELILKDNEKKKE